MPLYDTENRIELKCICLLSRGLLSFYGDEGSVEISILLLTSAGECDCNWRA